jgi:hypothetical protein
MCLGAMMFGAFGNPDHDDAVRIIHKALDAGINFIDTADGYSAGESEQILGQGSDGRTARERGARRQIRPAFRALRRKSGQPLSGMSRGHGRGESEREEALDAVGRADRVGHHEAELS